MSDPDSTADYHRVRKDDTTAANFTSTNFNSNIMLGKKFKLSKKTAKLCKEQVEEIDAYHRTIKRLSKSIKIREEALWDMIREDLPEVKAYNLKYDNKRTITVLTKL